MHQVIPVFDRALGGGDSGRGGLEWYNHNTEGSTMTNTRCIGKHKFVKNVAGNQTNNIDALPTELLQQPIYFQTSSNQIITADYIYLNSLTEMLFCNYGECVHRHFYLSGANFLLEAPLPEGLNCHSESQKMV